MAVLTEEQSLLRDAARAWAQERSPLGALRKISASGEGLGFDAHAFAEMAEMGWAGIVAPEEFGGADFGFHSMGVVLEQLGRTLTASPLIVSSLAAATGLRLSGAAALREAWLPKIASGEAIVSVAIDEGARHDPRGISLSAKKSGAKYKLSGIKRPVLFGVAAHAVIVAARTSGAPGDEAGVTLFLAPTNSENLSRTPLIEIEARGAAALHFDGVTLGPEAVLGAVDHGWPLLERMLDCARVGLSAQMLGSAESAFEITLAYLKTRKQFGQLIGSFQALQHRASVLHAELELTRSAVESALDALDANAPEAHELASLAKALAGDTFRRVAGEMIQMHGGIGMTEEHDAGLFLKRARIDDMSFGGAAFHRERYGRLAGY